MSLTSLSKTWILPGLVSCLAFLASACGDIKYPEHLACGAKNECPSGQKCDLNTKTCLLTTHGSAGKDGGVAGGSGSTGTAGTGGDIGTAGTGGDIGTAGAGGDTGTAGTVGDAGVAGTGGATPTAGTGGGAGAAGAGGTTGAAGTGGAGGQPGCADNDTRPCSAGGILGKCATGKQTCLGAKWGACSILPAAADLCDTKGDDSNCNGTANDGCPCITGDPARLCSVAGAQGNCAKGTQACAAGKWGACSIAPTTTDTCATKGDDANCNGVPNEGCACIVGDPARSCSAAGAKGNCAAGTQACANGQWAACSVQPKGADSCAVKLDDANCNGTVNDGCACITGDPDRLCSAGGAKGNCSLGKQSCQAGVWSVCSVQPTSMDNCTVKGDDGNCNGSANDNCPCVSGDTQVCGPAAVGICKPGTATCANGVWGGCVGAVNKGARDCTTATDNDCDGKPDNTIDTICKCTAGGTQACGQHPGNDGKGPCHAGSQTCILAAGKTSSDWGVCGNSVGPLGTDTCGQGNDDNCNGAFNDGCACVNGVTVRACGYCNDGAQTCTDGKSNAYTACAGATGQPFTNLALSGTWSPGPFSTAAPAATLDCTGVVQLRGACSATGTDTTMYLLPSILTPSSLMYLPIDLFGAAKGRLFMDTAGTSIVVPLGTANAAGFTSLEGVSYARTAAGFTGATLINGWVPYGTRNPAFRLDGKIVRLQGSVSGGTTAAIFNLPAGYRPPGYVYINADLFQTKRGRLYISAAGDVNVQANSGTMADATSFTSLEGVWFSVDSAGYTPLALQNGWTVYSGQRAPAVISDGQIVRFQGGLQAPANSVMQPFVLPVGFRPARDVYTQVDLIIGAKGRLNITTGGVVTIQAEIQSSDATSFTSLEGVSFGL